MHQDRHHYLHTLADELRAQHSRIRDLIGDAHWLTDGTHKEFLLSQVLGRHLPHGYKLSKGFVVHPAIQRLSTTEQDILILDARSEAPVFEQGGICITFPGAVAAAISVKSSYSKRSILDALIGLRTVRDLCERFDSTRHPWFGVFFFTDATFTARTHKTIVSHLTDYVAEHPLAPPTTLGGLPAIPLPHLVCSMDSLICRSRWSSELAPREQPFLDVDIYDGNGLAPAVFIADLLANLGGSHNTGRTGLSDLINNVHFEIKTHAVLNPFSKT